MAAFRRPGPCLHSGRRNQPPITANGGDRWLGDDFRVPRGEELWRRADSGREPSDRAMTGLGVKPQPCLGPITAQRRALGKAQSPGRPVATCNRSDPVSGAFPIFLKKIGKTRVLLWGWGPTKGGLQRSGRTRPRREPGRYRPGF